MLNSIISAIFGGTTIMDTVANAGKILGAIALVPAFYMWYQGHQGMAFHTITYGELFFWGPLFAAFVWVAHKAP